MYSLFLFFFVLAHENLGLGRLLSCWVALHHLVEVLYYFRTSTTWRALLLYLKLTCNWMHWIVCKHFCFVIDHLPCHRHLITNLFLPSMQDLGHWSHQNTISSVPKLLLGCWGLIYSLMRFASSLCCVNQRGHWAQATNTWLHSSPRS
jgi:hypothetical protein